MVVYVDQFWYYRSGISRIAAQDKDLEKNGTWGIIDQNVLVYFSSPSFDYGILYIIFIYFKP